LAWSSQHHTIKRSAAARRHTMKNVSADEKDEKTPFNEISIFKKNQNKDK